MLVKEAGVCGGEPVLQNLAKAKRKVVEKEKVVERPKEEKEDGNGMRMKAMMKVAKPAKGQGGAGKQQHQVPELEVTIVVLKKVDGRKAVHLNLAGSSEETTLLLMLDPTLRVMVLIHQ